MAQPSEVRTYHPAESIVFLKTNERFGGLSNMAPGFPLVVNGVQIRTSEALYQSCRFPHMPEVQHMIIDERSPMTAKMRSKPYHRVSRSDWNAVRVKIMRWCLRVKLTQNWVTFGQLLLSTGDRQIVEKKVRRKDFWGATEQANGTLVGMNVLGRLLMELREQLKGDKAKDLQFIEPPQISKFLLFSQPIEAIQMTPEAETRGWTLLRPSQEPPPPPQSPVNPGIVNKPRRRQSERPIASDTKPTDTNFQVKVASNRNAAERYVRYRESGLPWLNEIPDHWDVRRNGRLFTNRVETSCEELPVLKVSTHMGVGVRDMENGAYKRQMTDPSRYKRAAAGDIAYNTMCMWQGAVGVAPVDGLISPAYVVARPFSEVDSRYYAYLFRTPAYMREVNKFSRGIVSNRNRLYWGEFKQMPSAFPPLNEQTKIADFLDGHGRLVARIVRNKRRLIDLLNEQKQAIIGRIITRGLNPNASTKPTGIYWMTEVPTHWEVRKLKQVASFNPSRTESSADFDDNDEVVFLPMENVSATGEVDYSARGKVADFRGGYTYFKRHDVVVAKITPCFENGKSAYLGALTTEIGFGTTEFVVLRAGAEINPRFLHQITMLQAFRRDGEMAMTGAAGQQRVPLSFIREFAFGLPDLQEQERILACVDRENSKINRTIEKTQLEITLVQEYRERLITDVVTGKLDVRHVELVASAEGPFANTVNEESKDGKVDAMERADAYD